MASSLCIIILLVQKTHMALADTEHIHHKRYLSSLPEVYSRVGYGILGKHGRLGYERRQVSILGEHSVHALSMHPPYMGSAIVEYDISKIIGKSFNNQVRLVSRVAINDNNNSRNQTGSLLTWHLFADGRQEWASEPMDRTEHVQTANIVLRSGCIVALLLYPIFLEHAILRRIVGMHRRAH